MEYILAIVIAVAIAAIFALAARRSKKNDKQFDERQQLARGSAFRLAFKALVIYLAGYSILCAIFERGLMEPGVEGMFGVFLSLTFFAVDCILHDAFFQIGQNGRSYLILCAVIVLVSGLNAARHLRAGDLIANGMLTFEALLPFEALCFLAIGAAVIVKLRREKREAGDEES